MNLRALRKAARLTQEDLAKRVGRSQPWASRIERHKNPQISSLAEYVEALGCILVIEIRSGQTRQLISREEYPERDSSSEWLPTPRRPKP